jgi:cytochrome P450
MMAGLFDHLAWVFRPARFLFDRLAPPHLHLRGFETICFVHEPQDIAFVNKTTGSMFLGGAGNEFLVALLGEQSAFTLDGEAHRLARKIVGPTLNQRTVAEQQALIESIIGHEIARWRTKGWRNVGDWSRWLTMRVLCQLVLNIDDETQVRRLYEKFEATTGYLANIVSYCKAVWRPKGPVSIGHVVRYLVTQVDQEIYAVIASARTRLNMQAPAPERQTALEALILGQALHAYDDAFIRDNLVALLAAGYDTTGSALSWTLFWLGREGKSSETSTEAFRTEVLRYCPPVEILPRRINPGQLEEVCDLLPSVRDALRPGDTAGPLVSPCVHRVHHDPQRYPDPSRFNPARFAEGSQLSPNKFLPFGAGGRMCLGINLAKMILDCVINGISAANLKVQTSSTEFSPVRRNVSIWPGWRLRAKLQPVSI